MDAPSAPAPAAAEASADDGAPRSRAAYLGALFGAAGLLALADGWLQPGNPVPMLRFAMAAWSVLGAWALGLVVVLLTWPLVRERAPLASTGLAVGAFLGGVPFLYEPLPIADATSRVAVAHTLGTVLAFLLFRSRLLRPGPPRRLALALPVPAAAVVVAALLVPHPIPSGHLPPDPSDAVPPSDAPNVVLVSVDTLRADALFEDPTRPGVPRAEVPFLDGLRERALWARFALSSSDQTLPGHLGMLSGRDAMGHGLRSNAGLPDPAIPLLAERFHAAGFATAGVISNGLVGAVTGMDRGFDLFSEEPIELARLGLLLQPWLERHTWLGRCLPRTVNAELFGRLFLRRAWARRAQPVGGRVLEVALRQRRELPADRPSFHFVHFMDPHTDYDPPEPWRGRWSDALLGDLDPRYVPDPRAPIGSDVLDRIEEGLAAGDPAAEAAARWCHLLYLEEVAYVDDQLRRLVEAVEAEGRPTVFLVTGDHGEHFGEHGLMEHANSLFEENLRVPFLLWGPGVAAGEAPRPPHLADVVPTLLELAGLPAPDDVDGVSWAHGAPPPRAHVAADARHVAVRFGGLKWFGAWAGETDDDVVPVQVVDLAADPFEERPRRDAALDALPEDLRAAVVAALARDTHAERSTAAAGAEQQAFLRALGYAGN